MKGTAKRDGKRSHNKRGTTLWYVWLCLSENAVYVSEKPRSELSYTFPANQEMRIRTISPRAAGRKYIRCNLLFRLAEWNVRDRFAMSHCIGHEIDFINKKDLKAAKAHAPKNLQVKVLK